MVGLIHDVPASDPGEFNGQGCILTLQILNGRILFVIYTYVNKTRVLYVQINHATSEICHPAVVEGVCMYETAHGLAHDFHFERVSDMCHLMQITIIIIIIVSLCIIM